jgi:putative hemin transport protein
MICIAAAWGMGALAAHADGDPAVKASYVTTAVMEAAGVDLSGETLPGAGLEFWRAKPEEQVVFLKGDWIALLDEVRRLGDVSVLTGNEAVMHLSTGSYDRFEAKDGQALVVSKGVDLRLFTDRWACGAAILPASGAVPGFIFFNNAGEPVHRILLTPTSHGAEFEALVAQFKGEAPSLSPAPETPGVVEAPTEATRAALLEGWRALKDTHEFSALLSTHKVSRKDALRLAEGEFTAQLDPASYSALFGQLVDEEVSILLFALNNGCVQISTGAITEINRARGTLQLVEEDSRTLIALPRVKEVWRVSKPTERGLVDSLELYDEAGEPVAYLFGSEKGDSTSIMKWKELLFALPVAGEAPLRVADTTTGTPATL